jgi:hypothetical protein
MLLLKLSKCYLFLEQLKSIGMEESELQRCLVDPKI